MQVTFLKQKTYTDGSQTLILKNGVVSADPLKAQYKREQTRKLNRLKRQARHKKLIEEYNNINTLLAGNRTQRRLHAIECLLSLRNLADIKRSANRARQELQDICACNHFYYFLTLTFDKDKVNRLNDRETRAAYTAWAKEMHRRFPKMYFVTVPEYHKKGGLHFHLLVGGINFDDFKPEFYKNTTKGKHKGQPIYNVTAWENGYSTVTLIQEQNATKNYICKYITKQNFDERFFAKKRYYVSRNIQRPLTEKATIRQSFCNLWNIDFDNWDISYFSRKKQYGIFKHVQPPQKEGIQTTMRKSLLEDLQPQKNTVDSQNRAKVWEVADKCGIGELAKILTPNFKESTKQVSAETVQDFENEYQKQKAERDRIQLEQDRACLATIFDLERSFA